MSATIIKILNSGTSGSPSSLATGELAYSYLSGTLINGGDRLYIGTGTETNGEAANIEVIGGKYFTDMLDHTKGVLTINSALIVDANGKLDVLNVDNITLNGNTISTTDTNGDLIIDPDGTGLVQVSSKLYVTGDLEVDGSLDLGSVGIVGDLTVTGISDLQGQVTAGSLNVTDLTAGRVVYVSTDGELVDSAQLKFNGTTLVVGYDALTPANRLAIDTATGNLDTIGNITVGGTLGVSGESTLASATVSDLTDNRIVIAGTAGSLEDDANFTFDGTTFNIGQGNFTVDVATGDLYSAGSQTIDGQTTLGSLNVTDLTATRVVFAGTDGELVDSADFAFVTGTSTLNLTGQLNVDNVRVDGNTISATNTDGNVTISPNGVGYIDLTGSQAVKIPVGTLAQRPGGIQGQIRFNITDQRFEGFDGTAWNGLGGVVDVDQNTFVRAETSPGANNNDLEFYTDGVKRINLDENGMVFTDDSIPLQVGNIVVEGNTISTTTGGTLYLDPNPVGSAGTVVIEGNLQVNGTTTTVNSTEVTVQDPVMILGSNGAGTSTTTTLGPYRSDMMAFTNFEVNTMSYPEPRLVIDLPMMDLLAALNDGIPAGTTVTVQDMMSNVSVFTTTSTFIDVTSGAGEKWTAEYTYVSGNPSPIGVTRITFTVTETSGTAVDDNRDRGIAFNYAVGSTAKLGFFGWDDSTGRFTFIADATEDTSIFSGVAGDVTFGNLFVDSITIDSFTSNGVMYTDTSGDVQFAASSTEGHVLQINSSGVPVFGIIDCGTY